MLSKSKGQILRVAAALHVLFSIDSPLAIPDVVSDDAIEAAIDLVDVCIQHAAFLAGRGDVQELVADMAKGNEQPVLSHIIIIYIHVCMYMYLGRIHVHVLYLMFVWCIPLQNHLRLHYQ